MLKGRPICSINNIMLKEKIALIPEIERMKNTFFYHLPLTFFTHTHTHKHTHTHTQNTRNRRKKNVAAVNSICGKSNGIRWYPLRICSVYFSLRDRVVVFSWLFTWSSRKLTYFMCNERNHNNCYTVKTF